MYKGESESYFLSDHNIKPVQQSPDYPTFRFIRLAMYSIVVQLIHLKSTVQLT
jgi:hypothetical protein